MMMFKYIYTHMYFHIDISINHRIYIGYIHKSESVFGFIKAFSVLKGRATEFGRMCSLSQCFVCLLRLLCDIMMIMMVNRQFLLHHDSIYRFLSFLIISMGKSKRDVGKGLPVLPWVMELLKNCLVTP